ncbi:MAG: glycosyltransferase [Planctomycetes bacterium]|nr:glycosyltransferase [Planctomycetota bacterium]
MKRDEETVRILFVGHHMPHYTHTNVYREKAIKELGHELSFFDDRGFRLPGRIRDRIDCLQKWDFQRLNNKLVNVARLEKPRLCLVMGTRLMLPLPQCLEQIKAMGIKVVTWITDPPHDPPYSDAFHFIRATAPFYNHVFCAGTEAIDILKDEGIGKITWLPFACDPDYHRKVPITGEDKREYGRDIAFVGAYYPNRWQIFRELEEFDLGIWGPSWGKVAERMNTSTHIKDVKIDVSQWVKIYSAAKIVIVTHFHGGKTPCYQASPKIYEALACGSFVLVDNQKDVFSLFENGKHLVLFDNIEDLKQKIRYYLKNPGERKEIAERGRQEVLANHTYRHRIERIIETSFKSQI